ncbi:MAG: polysaccharide deacetylase family protein [Candidatus Acidiferrales bacterium]
MEPITRIVTTSWDDGDPADLKVASLLGTRGLPGTFFIPMTGYRGRQTLLPRDLRSLAAEGFEIGAHSLTHRTLQGLPVSEIEHEVRGSKQALEGILGSEVPMFCYPRGRFDHSVSNQLKAAGFRGARTTRMLSIEADFSRFEMPTSLQVYPHTDWTYFKNIAKSRETGRLLEFARRFRGSENWVALGKLLFDRVMKDGGIWHLYGHSWEIEELGLWKGLAELLDYVRGREGIHYATNTGTLNAVTGYGSQAQKIRNYVETQNYSRS